MFMLCLGSFVYYCLVQLQRDMDEVGERLALLPLAEMGIPRLGAFDRPQSWSF